MNGQQDHVSTDEVSTALAFQRFARFVERKPRSRKRFVVTSTATTVLVGALSVTNAKVQQSSVTMLPKVAGDRLPAWYRSGQHLEWRQGFVSGVGDSASEMKVVEADGVLCVVVRHDVLDTYSDEGLRRLYNTALDAYVPWKFEVAAEVAKEVVGLVAIRLAARVATRRGGHLNLLTALGFGAGLVLTQTGLKIAAREAVSLDRYRAITAPHGMGR